MVLVLFDKFPKTLVIIPVPTWLAAIRNPETTTESVGNSTVPQPIDPGNILPIKKPIRNIIRTMIFTFGTNNSSKSDPATANGEKRNR